jgi:hypothetical protein
MRRLFTTDDALTRGLTIDALRWGEGIRWRRVERGVYADGPAPITPLDRARGRVLATSSPARGALAGVLLGLDGVRLDDRPTRKRDPRHGGIVIVDAIPCADALQTLVDLAATVDADRWEQSLESALRKGLVNIADIEAALEGPRLVGAPMIRRVLDRRPAGAPPTESLLETLMVQLARTVPRLGDLARQYEVHDANGLFVARLDLSDLERGFFLELDGEHHKGQPLYDARRESAVVAATGWLCGRFTWTEVTRIPKSTARRLDGIAWQAERRRFVA